MWLGLALIVWLWGLVLYLAAYYFAVWNWRRFELRELLGQDFYNAHIPNGGWEAVVVPTSVFVVTLVVVVAARGPIGAAAGWLSRHRLVTMRRGLVACNLALVLMAVPALHVGVVATRDGFVAARKHSRLEAAARRRWDSPFNTGIDMAQPVAAYRRSSGLTRDRLLLSADGIYRRTWAGCGGGVSQEGRFTWQDGVVLFDAPYSEDDERAGERLPNRLVEIRWGERSYLLPDSEEQWISFCNAVNSGAEPVMGRINPRCLMRDGDENRAATGRPILPEPWAGYLLPSPLAGRTTAVAGDGSTWVNLGADHGLREGMELYMLRLPTEPELQNLWASEPLRILEVTPQSCRLRTWVHRGTTLPAGLEVTSLAAVESAAR